MNIKAVTFDFWNTLFDSSNGTLRNTYRYNVFIEEASKIDPVTFESKDNQQLQIRFQQAMKASWEYFNHIWMNEQRTPDPVDTVKYFWNYLGLPEKPEVITLIAREFGECITKYPPKLMPGVKDIVERLYESGFQLGIVSDTGFSGGTELRKLLEMEGMLEYFSAFSFSNETGVSKPDPMAFITIFNELEIQAVETLHIGDIEKTDIIGAKNLGMKAIRYSGDTSSEIYKENTQFTVADKEIFSWEEFEIAFTELLA